MSFMDEVKNNTTNTTDYKLNLGGQHSVTGTYGWICPICGRGVAPDQKYCSCRPVVYVPPVNPWYPTWWYQVTCNANSGTQDRTTTYTTTSASTKTEV